MASKPIRQDLDVLSALAAAQAERPRGCAAAHRLGVQSRLAHVYTEVGTTSRVNSSKRQPATGNTDRGMSSRQVSGQPEADEHAVVESGQGTDLVAGQGKD